MMFPGAGPLPSTAEEKIAFVFARYDKDLDGAWKMSELGSFIQELHGDVMKDADFPVHCKAWGCDDKGPSLDHLKKRYEGKPELLEQEFGMCMGLSACIA
eukprot:TRINITY_DN37209_c0_g1_i1.p1 TRINITY_DN37209_c0_g1~~TRINITY_DN37209_c0_g1_i1.p1  ORF type:complete len:114 (+),score=39.01 TRINITY_DN37209_c0_g1_i1:45-344(+)